MLNDLSAVIFPHCTLPERIVKPMLSFFGTVTIFQPWLMEYPEILRDYRNHGLVVPLNPPPSLRPIAEFKALLSEFKTWITCHQDRGYVAFLNAVRKLQTGKEATWEIRGALRQPVPDLPAAENADPLKWHMVLHLAGEIEEQREDAKRILDALRVKRSPLRGVVEEEDLETLFEDLPLFEQESSPVEDRLEQVIEAWYGLFGGFLRRNEFLLTWNQNVVDYVLRLGESYQHEEKFSPVAVHFTWPDFSRHSIEDILEKRAQIFEDVRARALRNAMETFWRDPHGSLLRLNEIRRDIESSPPWDRSERKLNLDMRFLTFPKGSDSTDADHPVKHLDGKMLVLIREASDGRG